MMSDELLSQEEIEKLLAQDATAAGGTGEATPVQNTQDTQDAQDAHMSQADIDAISQANAEESQASSSPAPNSDTSAGPAQASAAGGGANNVRPVEFAPVNRSSSGPAHHGVDLILDVQVQVAVELGRARMRVKDVLALGPGAVVELDKHAGEPVEIVVNNKPIARGEVVVIDENFGIRITEIIDASERAARAKAA